MATCTQTDRHTHASCNALTLVWGSLRLAQINYFCVQWVKIFSSVHWRMKLRICTTVPDYFSSMYRSLTKKGHAWAVHMHYFVLRQGSGRIFVTSLHFTTKKHPCLHYHSRILHTNTPAQYKLNNLVSAPIKHVWLHLNKRHRSNIPENGLEVPC